MANSETLAYYLLTVLLEATTRSEDVMSLLSFALDNPALLVVPALGMVAAAGLVRLKKRYVNEGYLFRQSTRRK